MGKGSELEGYCIDLISEISQKLGLKYKTHLVKDGLYGLYNSVEGTWNGMIGEIVRGVRHRHIRHQTVNLHQHWLHIKCANHWVILFYILYFRKSF